jgi:hypothetical protein
MKRIQASADPAGMNTVAERDRPFWENRINDCYPPVGCEKGWEMECGFFLSSLIEMEMGVVRSYISLMIQYYVEELIKLFRSLALQF